MNDYAVLVVNCLLSGEVTKDPYRNCHPSRIRNLAAMATTKKEREKRPAVAGDVTGMTLIYLSACPILSFCTYLFIYQSL